MKYTNWKQILSRKSTARAQWSRSRILGAALAAALVCGLAGTMVRVIADNGGEDDGAPGGSIDGTAVLQAKVTLQPTNAAPAGASGMVEIKARNSNGVVSTKMEVKTYGLTAGDYLLNAVKKSDGSTETIGQITIGGSGSDNQESEKSGDHSGSGDSQGNDSNGGNHDNHQGHDSNNHDSGVLASETEVVLPADLDPLDIAQVIVADTSGNPLLVGDLVNVDQSSSVNYNANVTLKGAEAAPAAKGKAVASTTGKKGKRTDRFTLTASRLAANTTYSVMVNGHTVSTAKSNKKGGLMVKKLAANNLTISSVRLVDDQGRVAAKARF